MKAKIIVGALAVAAFGGILGVVACPGEPGPGAPAPEPQPPSPPAAGLPIQAPPGYAVTEVARGLSYPTGIAFSDKGEMFVAEAGGHTYGTAPADAPAPRILRISSGGSPSVVYEKTVSPEAIKNAATAADIPEGLIAPVVGLTWRQGLLYVAHRSRISTLDPATGEFKTIINDLPDWGFFHLSPVEFGSDGKMYFVMSSQGNAGPIDAHWMKVANIYGKQDAHEVACEDVTLAGTNFPVPVEDPSTPGVDDAKLTGAFVPLGTQTSAGQTIPGKVPCNGAVLRANVDGSSLELYAWGLRSVSRIRFAPDGRLIASQNGGNPIPPRAIYSDPDTFWDVRQGLWYGWPDYYSGIPVTDPRFAGTYDKHKFILSEETRQRLLKGGQPPQPLVRMPELHVAAQGFVLGRSGFGLSPDEVLVAEFGTVVTLPVIRERLPGFRVQRVNLTTGQVQDFLVNQSGLPASVAGTAGLERPLQLEFGPDGAVYIVDFGIIHLTPKGMEATANSGVVWKVTYDPGTQQ
jgi:glucose/arabinose dehydrogenase